MPIPEYVRRLRAAIGHERLILVGASAIIRDDLDRVLLVQRQDTGQWALPAGIMELDESISHTVVREVKEETGLEVKPVRLVGLYTDPVLQNMTYPQGDQVHVVNAAFECLVVGGELRADGVETSGAGFFAQDELPPLGRSHMQRLRDALSQEPEAYIR
jgi:ADP-ribose pyrophosphatase YjhB (NUDIX family)